MEKNSFCFIIRQNIEELIKEQSDIVIEDAHIKVQSGDEDRLLV